QHVPEERVLSLVVDRGRGSSDLGIACRLAQARRAGRVADQPDRGGLGQRCDRYRDGARPGHQQRWDEVADSHDGTTPWWLAYVGKPLWVVPGSRECQAMSSMLPPN